jgi:hypothetical protein
MNRSNGEGSYNGLEKFEGVETEPDAANIDAIVSCSFPSQWLRWIADHKEWVIAARSIAAPIPITNKPGHPTNGPPGDDSINPTATNTLANTQSRQNGRIRNRFNFIFTSNCLILMAWGYSRFPRRLVEHEMASQLVIDRQIIIP